jgi:apolipoprotein N-acyltransferase
MNRWMAVSLEVPVVRATIGGISGFISYDGRVTQKTSSSQTEVLKDSLIYKKDSHKKNIYARLGLLPLLILSLILFVFFFIIEKRGLRK